MPPQIRRGDILHYNGTVLDVIDVVGADVHLTGDFGHGEGRVSGVIPLGDIQRLIGMHVIKYFRGIDPRLRMPEGI